MYVCLKRHPHLKSTLNKAISMNITILLAYLSTVMSLDMPKELQDPVLFCEGCYGTMYEVDQLMINLKHLKLERRVQDTLRDVCHTDNLRKYVFSPPKMFKVSQTNSCLID